MKVLTRHAQLLNLDLEEDLLKAISTRYFMVEKHG